MGSARRCTCSYCRTRGAIAVSADLDDIEILIGVEALALYQFGAMTAKHYFCSVCGIYTHHQRRSNSNHYGFNVACLESVSPFDFPAVPVSDGVNHPADAESSAARIDRMLRYATLRKNKVGESRRQRRRSRPQTGASNPPVRSYYKCRPTDRPMGRRLGQSSVLSDSVRASSTSTPR